MSDLLERARALNPVPACDSPSIADVWRKLEGEQVPALGESGRKESRRAAASRVSSPTQRFGRSVTGRRGLVAVCVIAIAAAVVVMGAGGSAGGQPAAAPRGGESSAAVSRLAHGTITCAFASAAGAGPGAVVVPTRGRSAVAYCRGRDGTREGASRARFVVCQTSTTNVAVYLADGRRDRCHRLGERAVPPGYAEAVRQTRSDSAVEQPGSSTV